MDLAGNQTPSGTKQLRSRAPLRLGLAGGGTDIAAYSDTYGGAVLNATIDRYAYAHLSFRKDARVMFRASDLGVSEEFAYKKDISIDTGLILHRAVYNRIVRDFLNGETPSLSVSTTIDAPPGSGLGSSSALVVALVEVFRKAFNLPLGPYDVARLAFQIEREDIRQAGGKQDHYSAAFGGLNFMEFLTDGRVIVNPLRVARAALHELEAALLICFTGQSRRSDTIIGQQLEGITSKSSHTVEGLHQLKSDAIDMKTALLKGDLRGMAQLLDRSWKAKRATAVGISNAQIEKLYDHAIANGAWAGKISGAGGGGFMMLLTDPENRYRLIETIRASGMDANPVHFTNIGAETWSAIS